ncbi:hypothetical protein [Clostridium sp. HBUAS56017]|uniref:hypothetical protein n=1 Tax=Clostridium sp. HBUAS56017 TaxID=2571128 RepID=UPI00117838F8|nr:hypothetical protein [Clostridium sp. HBUAS56017]
MGLLITGLFIFKIIFTLSMPIAIIALGKYLIKNTPKEIKRDFVYRSSMSTKNKDTLEFAYNHCGKILIPIGWSLFIATIIAMMFMLGKDKVIINFFCNTLILIQGIFLGTSVFSTERALRRSFDEYGNRK